MKKQVSEIIGYQSIGIAEKYLSDIEALKRDAEDMTELSVNCFIAGYLAGIRDTRSGRNEGKLRRG